jgi:hypothetical protein
MTGCDGHSHDHEHSEPDDTNTSLGTSLRPSIDLSNVRCLNESRPGAGREILKLYDERWTAEPKLLSQEDHDEEPELLLVVPFTEAVSIKSLCVFSHAGNNSAMTTNNNNNTNITAPPRTVRIFVNRQNLDLDDCRDLEPDAEIILVPPTHQWSEEHASGTIDYMLRPAGRFANVSEVALYFPDNYYDMEQEQQQQQQQQSLIFVQTEITYIMFKGKGTNVKRRAVEAVYETRGMTKDHKTPGAEYFGQIGL